MIIGLHHFGFAVEDLDKAVELYESLGFSVAEKFDEPSIKAKAVMMKKDTHGIELWEFEDMDLELPKKIKRHFAFASDDIENDVQAYLDAGYKISIPVTKTDGVVVKSYAYVEDELGNQIELVEPLQ